jgi:hypothetical protein
MIAAGTDVHRAPLMLADVREADDRGGNRFSVFRGCVREYGAAYVDVCGVGGG